MEIVIIVLGTWIVAYALGYRRGRRAASVVNMSERDLRRALARARKQ